MKKNSRRIDEIRQALAHCLPELKKEYHVESLEIFGSRLRGDNRPESDIDILVSFSSTLHSLNLSGLRTAFQKFLG